MDPKVSSARLLCADQAQQDARPQEVDFVLEGILGPGTSVDGISYVGDLGTAWFKRAIQQLNRVQDIVTTLEKQKRHDIIDHTILYHTIYCTIKVNDKI